MRAPRADASCPCGSGTRLDACCGPALAGVPAVTAEALMRSRYTAFAVGDEEYLRASWHPGTRPADVAPDPDTRWVGLRIVAVEGGGVDDKRGTVEFEARWCQRTRQGMQEGVLHERSRFVRQSGRWWYLDGRVS